MKVPYQFSSLKDELEKEVEQSKTVNLELVFGYHWKPGAGASVSFAEALSGLRLRHMLQL